MGVKLPKKQKMFDQERLTHFSLRKFHSGLASVAVATSLLFLGAAAVAADETAETPAAEETITAVEPATESSAEPAASAETSVANTTEPTIEATTGATEGIASEELTETFDAPVEKAPLQEIVEKAKVVLGDANLPEGYRHMLEEAIARGENFLDKDKLTKVELDYALSSLNSLLDTISREQATRAAATTGTSSTDSDQHKVAATFYPMANKTTVTGSTFADSRVVVTAGEQTAEVQSSADGSYTLDVTGGKKGLVVTADTYNADGALVGTAVAISTMSSRTNRPANEGQAIPTGTAFRATPANVDFNGITNFASVVPGSGTGAYANLTVGGDWVDVNGMTGSITQKFTLYGEESQVVHNIAPNSTAGATGYKTPEFANRYIINGFPDTAWGRTYKDNLYYVYNNGSGRFNELQTDNGDLTIQSRHARIDPVQGFVLRTVYTDRAGLEWTVYTATSIAGEMLHHHELRNTTNAVLSRQSISYKLDTMLAGVDSVPAKTLGGDSGIIYIENQQNDGPKDAFRVRFRLLKGSSDRIKMEAGHYRNPNTPIDQDNAVPGQEIPTGGDSGVRFRFTNVNFNPGETLAFTTGDQIRLKKPITFNLREQTILKGQLNGWTPKNNFVSAQLNLPDGQVLPVTYEEVVPIAYNLDTNTPGRYKIIFDADGAQAETYLNVLDTLTTAGSTHTVTEHTPLRETEDGATPEDPYRVGATSNYPSATFKSGKITTGVLTEGPVNGLKLDATGHLVGTPVVTDWQPNEDSRTVTIDVETTDNTQVSDPADPSTTMASPQTKTTQVTVTILRDTDGDGIPDIRDTDDDGDGIPDNEDTATNGTRGSKDFDALTATPTPKTVQEKKRIADSPVVITVNKKGATVELEDMPAGVSGLAVDRLDDKNFKLSGTPAISNWQSDDEEVRDVELTAVVKHTSDEAKRLAPLRVTIPVTIYRDTDGDGTPDTTDTDDDNDGIPDGEDQRPKNGDALTGTPTGQTLTEKSPVPAGTKVAASNKKDTTFTIESITKDGTATPVTGLVLVPNTDKNEVTISGTPRVADWASDAEEGRDVIVRVKLTHAADRDPAFVDVPIKILRDTDGDGTPDNTGNPATSDADDDGDGIPDDQDATPKVKTNLDATTTNQVLKEKASVPGTPVVIAANKPNSTYELGTLPEGLSGVTIDASTGVLSGIPVIGNWAPTEEVRNVTVPVKVIFTSTDTNVPNAEAFKSVTLTIYRDTDEDGLVDMDTPPADTGFTGDTDDDNDGILDADDTRGNGPKRADVLTGRPIPANLTEKVEVADNTNLVSSNKVGTNFVIAEITDRDGNAVNVSGLTLVSNGDFDAKLTGTPVVSDWGPEEESRNVLVKVSLTNDTETATTTVPVTILRDSDGDGIGDINDDDDDNDGIPDALDQEPATRGSKKPDPLLVTVFEKTLTDGQPVPARTDVINANKSINTTYEMGADQPHFSGVTIDPITGILTGTPVIDNWGATEEERYIFIPVSVVRKDDNGDKLEERNLTVQLLVQRDSDGDGIPDITDTDDDNDGIPDGEEQPGATKQWNELEGSTTAVTVTENIATPGTDTVVTANKRYDISYETGTLPEHLSGLTVNPTTGNLEGTPVVDNWGDTEESRDFVIPVTIVHSGAIPERLPRELTVTVKRDSDGDGIIDEADTDDDGDGIPDAVDSNPKTPDRLTGQPTEGITLTAGQPTPANTESVTVNKPNDISYELGTLPTGVDGITVDPTTGNLGGTPEIDNWVDGEEEREVLVPVIVKHTPSDPNVAPEEITVFVPVTIQRDSDSDGIPDVTDADDDNDGIPDELDNTVNGPQEYDDLTVAPQPVTVSAGHPVADDTALVDANKPNATYTLGDLPAGVSGLEIDQNGNIIGTPEVDWTDDAEESRTIEVEVTVKHSNSQDEEVTVTVPITIIRDQDGDGIPDSIDNDDDGDDIPDDEDESPKDFDALKGNTGPVVIVDNQSVPADAEQGVTGTNKPNAHYELGNLPADFSGIAIDDNGFITGTPVISNWGADEEVRDVAVPVIITRTLSNGTEETHETTITVRVLRDTDGDGLPDVDAYTTSAGVDMAGDTDDDNDDIPDTLDKRKKAFDKLAAGGTAIKLPEGADVSAIPVVTANKPGATFAITNLPAGLTGLTITPNGDYTAGFTGTPAITNWGDTEEARTVEVEVTITRTLSTGELETEVVRVPVTVQRDTDRDGIADTEDTDDDNDGIPDFEDKESKAYNNLEAAGRAIVLIDNQAAGIAPALATANKYNVKYFLSDLFPYYVTGLSLTTDGMIVGTPHVSNWQDGETERTFNIRVTANYGSERQTVTSTITIKRYAAGGQDTDATDNNQLPNNDNQSTGDDKLNTTDEPKSTDAIRPLVDGGQVADAAKDAEETDKSVEASAASAETAKEKAASLPNTGEAANPAAAGLAVLMSALGLMGLRRRKED